MVVVVLAVGAYIHKFLSSLSPIAECQVYLPYLSALIQCQTSSAFLAPSNLPLLLLCCVVFARVCFVARTKWVRRGGWLHYGVTVMSSHFLHFVSPFCSPSASLYVVFFAWSLSLPLLTIRFLHSVFFSITLHLHILHFLTRVS